MEQSKKEFLAVLQGMKLSKTQKPDHGRRKRENESHSLYLRFYKVCHAVYQIYCIPYTVLSKGVQ